MPSFPLRTWGPCPRRPPGGRGLLELRAGLMGARLPASQVFVEGSLAGGAPHAQGPGPRSPRGPAPGECAQPSPRACAGPGGVRTHAASSLPALFKPSSLLGYRTPPSGSGTPEPVTAHSPSLCTVNERHCTSIVGRNNQNNLWRRSNGEPGENRGKTS